MRTREPSISCLLSSHQRPGHGLVEEESTGCWGEQRLVEAKAMLQKHPRECASVIDSLKILKKYMYFFFACQRPFHLSSFSIFLKITMVIHFFLLVDSEIILNEEVNLGIKCVIWEQRNHQLSSVSQQPYIAYILGSPQSAFLFFSFPPSFLTFFATRQTTIIVQQKKSEWNLISIKNYIHVQSLPIRIL